MVEGPAQAAFHAESRCGSLGDCLRRDVGAQPVLRDRPADRLAMRPRRMDAAGSQRRHDAGRIAGQDHAGCGEAFDRSAAGNQAGARRIGLQGRRQSQACPDARAEAVDVGYAMTIRAMPERESELHAGRRLRGPADVTGRERAVDEAVQGVGFRQRGAVEFVFDAVEKCIDQAQARALGDA